MDCRQCGGPEVYCLVLYGQTESPILGDSSLGNIHASKDLDAGYHTCLSLLGRSQYLMEHTIHTIPYSDVFFLGLQMNIICFIADCIGND